jgi:hypothetical protein
MKLAPSQLNVVFRLFLIAKRCGAKVLDNVESFDRVMGRGRFASLDCEVLNEARRIVKASANGGGETGVYHSDTAQDVADNGMGSQDLAI